MLRVLCGKISVANSFCLVCGEDFDRQILHNGASRLYAQKALHADKVLRIQTKQPLRVRMVMWLDATILLVHM